ncbi:CDP-alcohol phosphatidyltransferase family protein [Archaeoglobales archaeon]|nr:MAG: CDP-alcohol phosphatidyltransferase family protein [Archaeoglobales archaeon]
MVYRRFSRPLARFLSKYNVSPNLITIIASAIGILAGLIIYYGRIFEGVIIIFISQILDCTDGDLARLTGRVTALGGYLDRIFDRFVDAAIIIGIVGLNPSDLWAIGILAIIGSFGVSISRAMAEAYNVECKVGIGSRDTRLAIIMIGLLLQQYFATLAIIAFLGILTTIHRMAHTVRKMQAVS